MYLLQSIYFKYLFSTYKNKKILNNKNYKKINKD